ncbi:MAG: hypothetical protein WAN36_08130 [Calditrichia bacterium]
MILISGIAVPDRPPRPFIVPATGNFLFLQQTRRRAACGSENSDSEQDAETCKGITAFCIVVVQEGLSAAAAAKDRPALFSDFIRCVPRSGGSALEFSLIIMIVKL